MGRVDEGFEEVVDSSTIGLFCFVLFCFVFMWGGGGAMSMKIK